MSGVADRRSVGNVHHAMRKNTSTRLDKEINKRTKRCACTRRVLEGGQPHHSSQHSYGQPHHSPQHTKVQSFLPACRYFTGSYRLHASSQSRVDPQQRPLPLRPTAVLEEGLALRNPQRQSTVAPGVHIYEDIRDNLAVPDGGTQASNEGSKQTSRQRNKQQEQNSTTVYTSVTHVCALCLLLFPGDYI